MIGLVIVSHSPRLAEAAVELALEMVHGEAPPMRIAAGVDGRVGTDATAGATSAAILVRALADSQAERAR